MTFYLTPPYRLPVVDTRWSMYSFTGTPSVMFDGSNAVVGGSAAGSMFTSYNPYYLGRKATPSPLEMTSSFTIMGDQATVTTTLTVDLAMPGGTNQAQFYVALDPEHGNRYMVVSALTPETLAISAIGEQVILERTFTVSPGWEQESLRIVTVVQNTGTQEILQGALAVPDYKASIVIDCEPDGVGAGWALTGPYGLLAEGNGDRTLNTFYPGEFTLAWQDVPYWTEPTPGTVTQTVNEGGQLVFTGVYSDGPFGAPDAAPGDPAAATRGVSMVDYDGDGDLDLHILQDGAADQLLRNDNGAFAAAGSGPILDAGAGQSAAWADFNGDGHLDVYVGRSGEANLLLVGDGSGGFAPANGFGAGDVGQARTVSWVDYDNDDILDLYVVNASGANVLLKGMGDVGGGFYIFTAQSNGADDPSNGRGLAWVDVDFDGRLDVYVVNSFAANLLLQNLSFGFSNIAQGKGIDDAGNGAGAAWGDMDNDGDWDLYVANDGTADRLFQADGEGFYNLVVGPNLGDRGHARDVVFADLDNDTFLDLYVARASEPDLLLVGDGTGSFDLAPVGWPEAGSGCIGVACGDVDGDGRLDIFLSREGGADVLLHNTIVHDNHWFAVRLRGKAGNRAAIGALVKVVAGGVTQMRQVTAGGGYLGADSGPVHFGLGAVSSVHELSVTWPDGTVQTVGPLHGDRVLDVVYGDVLAAEDPVPAASDRLAGAHPNPFNPATTINYSIARAGRVRLEVFAVDGRRVRTLVAADQAAGDHRAVWNGQDDHGQQVASGTYLYRLVAPGGATLSGRVALVK